MGFLDALRKAFGGKPARPLASAYWVYVQCQRCGEPLKGRINLQNDPSHTDDGTAWVVRKGLVGSGARRCFQTVEVTLTFSLNKSEVLDQEISGGKFITAEEYEALIKQPPESGE